VFGPKFAGIDHFVLASVTSLENYV